MTEEKTTIERLMTDEVVDIHGTEYTVIAARVRLFREDHPDWSIKTRITFSGDLVRCRAVIADETKRIRATGHSEEERGASNINATSAVENCETSAVGRALAFVSGEYAGSAIRSAEEMSTALIQQLEKRLWKDWSEFTEMVELHHDSLVAIREFLAADNFDAAREAWNEISNEEKMILWRATTKGGWFSPRERQQMKWWSNDFEKGRKDG